MQTIKVFVAGPTRAGKTTLVHKFDQNARSIEHYYDDGSSTTIGFDLGVVFWDKSKNKVLKNIEEGCNNPNIFKVILMGSPGQLRFAPVRQAVSKGSQGVLFVIDSTNLGQVGLAISIYEEIKAYFKSDFPMVILANKQDLDGAADAETIRKLLKITTAKVIETSAITGSNLEEGLLELLNMVYDLGCISHETESIQVVKKQN